MDFLILSPPAASPAEPPAGAFLLAAGLCARGYDAALFDLSLAYFRSVLSLSDGPDLRYALSYIEKSKLYVSQKHRGAAGIIHKKLNVFTKQHPGWRLSLMDLEGPAPVHRPEDLVHCLREHDPFRPFYEAELGPVLDRENPRKVLISLSYLSQLAATLSLVEFLKARGIEPTVGGSLPSSMARTARGLPHLASFFPNLSLGDGLEYIPHEPNDKHLLSKLAWPRMISAPSAKGVHPALSYLSSRPIVPLTLSVGCFWNRCLFCPDRDLPTFMVDLSGVERFLQTMPECVRAARPIVHLLDSAMPPAHLRRFLPLIRNYGLEFYGFARPDRHLLKDHLLEDCAASGCRMLQLGVESGSKELLDRYNKGLSPAEARELYTSAASLGIRTYIYLLFGLPKETAADRKLTLDMIEETSESVDFLNLSLFNLPRDCELFNRAEEFGIEVDPTPPVNPLQLYQPFLCDGVPPRAEARRYLAEIFQKHPAVRPAFLQTPRWFRAAHLALFDLKGRRP